MNPAARSTDDVRHAVGTGQRSDAGASCGCRVAGAASWTDRLGARERARIVDGNARCCERSGVAFILAGRGVAVDGIPAAREAPLRRDVEAGPGAVIEPEQRIARLRIGERVAR